MKIAKYACLLGDESKPTAERSAITPARSTRILRQGNSAKVTKLEAVRRALAHGAESPLEGIRFIKRQYGIDVSPTVFSTYKCRLGEGPIEAAEPTFEGQKSEEKPPATEMLELAKTIKLLVEQHGPETVRSFVDLFTSPG